jgi:hypothetical protein
VSNLSTSTTNVDDEKPRFWQYRYIKESPPNLEVSEELVKY